MGSGFPALRPLLIIPFQAINSITLAPSSHPEECIRGQPQRLNFCQPMPITICAAMTIKSAYLFCIIIANTAAAYNDIHDTTDTTDNNSCDCHKTVIQPILILR